MKLFYNGIVRSLDDDNNCYEAVLVKDGKIEFLGSTEEALKLKFDEKIDLKGMLMLPGFVDSHMHAINYAFVENSVKLFDCTSVTAAIGKVANYLKENPDRQWIYSRGWNDDSFDEKRYPTKEEIDNISKDIPIILVRVCGHVGVANTKGLEMLKLTSEYDSFKAEVDLEKGLIKENALQFYYSILDKPSPELIKEYISLAMKNLNEAGITSIQSDDLGSLPGKDWKAILTAFDQMNKENKMTVRFYEQCLFEQIEDFEVFLKDGYRTGQGENFFKIGSLKILEDGSLGARTAALEEEYADDKGNNGLLIMSQEELDKIVKLADDNQMQVAIHGIGDRSINTIIRSLEKVGVKENENKMRHGIVHAQITNEDILNKMGMYGLIAYVQPVFVGYDMSIVESRVGKDREKLTYAWKTMMEKGAIVTGGSDAPVEPFSIVENIHYAVNRTRLDQTPVGGWKPEEKLSVDESVKIFTKYPAFASFSEDMNGTIEIGKYADLVVLDKDIYNIEEELIKDTKVKMTVSNGNIVYIG